MKSIEDILRSHWISPRTNPQWDSIVSACKEYAAQKPDDIAEVAKETFTIENIENLKSTCQRIVILLDENVDGDFMMVQLICLGDRIKEFRNNPIIKNSGI
jgi:hypothetical protein